MIEPAVGASTCASGSQVWNGNIGTLTAKAAAKARKTQFWKSVGRCRGPGCCSSRMSSVPVLQVDGDDGHQHQQRAGQRVEEELDGRVDAVGEPQMPISSAIGTSMTSQKM